MIKKKKELTILPINDIDEYLDHLWYELGDIRKIKYTNELTQTQWDDKEAMPELVVELARNPDYLHFVVRYILGIDLLPFQVAILQQMWTHPLVLFISTRGGGKSWLLSVYLILRCLLHQGCKFAVVGAALRQSLVLFQYVTQIWENAPILRDICGGKQGVPKRELHAATWKCGLSTAMFLPMGTGDKIRGLRACVGPNTLIETNRGLVRIKDAHMYMDEGLKVLTHNGNWIAPSHWVKTKPIDAYEVKMLGGYSIICSDIHKFYTRSGWKGVLELTTDDEILFKHDYKFSEEYIEIDGLKLDESLGWLLGISLAEGNCKSKHGIGISMTDFECLDRIENGWKAVKPDISISRYEKDGYTDKRGWACKPTQTVQFNDTKFRAILSKFGLSYTKAREKTIPWSILQSPKPVIIAFLAGLFEGDGTMHHYKDKSRLNNLAAAYYSGSGQLCQEVQVLLHKFGIFGQYATRESRISDKLQYFVRFAGSNAPKLYELLRINKWSKWYDQAYKSERWIANREYLIVRSATKLPDKMSLYDFSVPEDESFVGNCLANHNTYIVGDEIASISPEIFETVVRGFAAVKSDGLHGNVVKAYKQRAMEDLGLSTSQEIKNDQDAHVPTMLASNQIIMAGTANFQFNHVYKYYRYYKAMILSGGSKKKLKDEFPDMPIPDEIRPQDYSVIRLPYTALPPDMMDSTIMNQGKATMDPAIFGMEYQATFPSDSEGFYLASQIKAATAPVQSNSGPIAFGAKLCGDKQGFYTMGIDPASENDNFAVHIIEINSNYNGSVYQWSTNRKTFEELQRLGAIDQDIKDYNTFVMWHIRSLLKRFNVSLIACDAGGGGLALRELFKDPDKTPKDELPILDMDDENTERMQGQRILKMVEFSNYQWRREAHYGLKKDIMDKRLVFPQYDLAAIEAANANDRGGTSFDTVEDCYLELEQCKSETMMIRHTMTGTGQEKWDVPRMLGVDSEEMRKRLKKDRFTSLLLANWAARLVTSPTIGEPRNDEGVLAQATPKNYAAYAPCVEIYNPSTNLSRKIFY